MISDGDFRNQNKLSETLSLIKALSSRALISLLLLLLSRFSRADSVRPHRRQPIRLPHPWDSPGKNTGVSCHFLLRCMKVKSESEVAQSCLTLCDTMDCSLPGSSVHGIFQASYWSGVPLPSPTNSIHTYIIHTFVSIHLLMDI